MEMLVQARDKEKTVEAHNVCQQKLQSTSTQQRKKGKQPGRTTPFQTLKPAANEKSNLKAQFTTNSCCYHP